MKDLFGCSKEKKDGSRIFLIKNFKQTIRKNGDKIFGSIALLSRSCSTEFHQDQENRLEDQTN